MQPTYPEVATPFLPERVNEVPYIGYDCSCGVPSVYRQVIDNRGKSTLFSLCPICDNLPRGSAERPSRQQSLWHNEDRYYPLD